MMKKNKYITLFFLLVLTIFSCSKSDGDSNTTLTVNILDELGNRVKSSGNVLLYESKNNLESDVFIDSKVFIDDGIVKFDNLRPITYYFLAKSGCSTNFNNGVITASPLKEGANNNINAIISPQGSIKMVSKSSNKYRVFLDGEVKFDIDGGKTKVIDYVPIGLSRKIRVLQLEGYIVFPTDKTFDISIWCGSTTEVIFP